MVMQIDEIKIEERLRHDPATNMILGVGREDIGSNPVEFCSAADAELVTTKLKEGKMKLGSEV